MSARRTVESGLPPGAEVYLEVRDLAKRYGSRGIFRGVSFQLKRGESLAVAGPNGSGKSTLLRILCGLQRPSRGTVVCRVGETLLDERERRQVMGFVAPDLMLYEELTALENLDFFARVRGLPPDPPRLAGLLADVGLAGREHDLLRTFSSGMRQRLKYAFALLHRPPILVLDEPTAYLDETGVRMVRRFIAQQRAEGILVFATNEQEELHFGDRVLRLGSPGERHRSQRPEV
ncbi:MAG: heme ABC exporter ATP-binding protein CcmA [Armatimonadota bacterium]|nr:heme ABC exporter ATP-binding protein CcmA [Armatimonadota bacterium]